MRERRRSVLRERHIIIILYRIITMPYTTVHNIILRVSRYTILHIPITYIYIYYVHVRVCMRIRRQNAIYHIKLVYISLSPRRQRWWRR